MNFSYSLILMFAPGKMSEDYTASEKKKIDRRVQDLGIESLLGSDYKIDRNLKPGEISLTVENSMIKMGKKLGSPLMVGEKDVKNAIEFLELFSWHAMILAEKGGTDFVKDKTPDWTAECVTGLEHVLTGMEAAQKKILRPTVKRIIRKEDKLFETLGPVEQKALIDKVKAAEKILLRYFK